MIENSLETFSKEVIQFLTGHSKVGRGMLLKKHSENLHVRGDFSFPNSVKSWHEYFNYTQEESNNTLFDYADKQTMDLIRESRNWQLEIVKLSEEKGRIHMFLNRPKSIVIGLNEAVNNIIILEQILENDTNTEQVFCDTNCEDNDCLTSLRLKYLAKSVENLYSVVANRRECRVRPNVVLTTRSSYKNNDGPTMLCGAVLNSKTGGKETHIKADDYIRMRQNEMTLIAQHKYGVRVSTDAKWKEFVAHLGESAVKFELLQTKPCSAVKINFDSSYAGSSKGAAFILYNCARLEAIIRTYNDKVGEGIYPPLPVLEDTDFSLLNQEDEWTLIFNFIMGFPSLLESCADINEGLCDFKQHHICSFLCSMVRVFSQYYRKTRILVEPRKHLLPVLFARLHMLKILNDTLKTCLNILNIKSVSQMYIYFYFTKYINIPTASDERVLLLV